ncbi:MAG: O-antigen ligase family protein [Clostridium sp.]
MKSLVKNISLIVTNRAIFVSVYLLISLLFVTFASELPLIGLINKVTIIWGVALIPYFIYRRFANRKSSIKVYEILIIAFLLLTLALNIFSYFTTENLKNWLINNIYLIVLFLPDYKTSLSRCKKQLNVISTVFIGFSFITSVISIGMLIMDKVYTNSVGTVYTNAFSNENSLGLSAALAFLISLYMFFAFKNNKIIKFSMIINMIIQVIAVVLAGGRSSYIVFMALIFIYVFVKFKNIFIRLIMIGTPIGLMVIIVCKYIDKLYLLLTGREILWDTALKLIKTVPLTGVGNSDLVPRIRELTYEELLGIDAGGLHNMYIQVAAVNGVISCVLFIGILLSIFLFVLNKIDSLNKTKQIKVIPLFAVFVGIALVSLMESTLLYNISFISIIFWTYSSYLCTYVHEESK